MLSKTLDELREWAGKPGNMQQVDGSFAHLPGILARLIAELPPKPWTEAERELCDSAKGDHGVNELVKLAQAVYAENHIKPRTLDAIQRDIVRIDIEEGDWNTLQNLWNERGKLLDAKA